MSDHAATKRDQGADHQRTTAEWVTVAIASAILLVIVGLIVYDWIATPAAPPILTVQQNGDVREAGGQFYVPFTVENTGGDTAEAVQIVAELRVDGEVIEDGEQQIDFLAGSAQQAGEFIFSRDPASGELSIRVASYKQP